MKKIFGILLFICILCTSVKLIEYILRPTGDEDKCIDQIKAFHSIDENSLDVIAYGSSHGWLGFDANEFGKITGLRTYNFGCYWQSFNTTWLFFHDSLRYQSPDIALVETGRIADFLTGQGLEGQVLYTKEIDLSNKKIKYLNQCFADDNNAYLSYIFPLDKFHSNWKNLSSDSFFKKDQVGSLTEYGGQNISYAEMPLKPEYIGADMKPGNPVADEVYGINEYEGGEVGQQPIPDNCLELLNDICNACRNNDIILILYTIPYAGDYNYSDALTEYANNNSCYYINLFDHIEDMGLDSMTDFCDADHLNFKGAQKVSRVLADYLEQNHIN